MSNAVDVRASTFFVPIRSLGPGHRERIAAHLMALDGQDRYLRFGSVTSDDQVRRYVDGLDFHRDEIFGIYSRKLELIALTHLAFCPTPESENCAELGVSVLQNARGRGYGALLFDRAVMHARNRAIDLLLIHSLSENRAMLKIAANAGAELEHLGTETRAFLRLPPPTLETRMSQVFREQVGLADYRFKAQALGLRTLLAAAGKTRSGAD